MEGIPSWPELLSAEKIVPWKHFCHSIMIGLELFLPNGALSQVWHFIFSILFVFDGDFQKSSCLPLTWTSPLRIPSEQNLNLPKVVIVSLDTCNMWSCAFPRNLLKSKTRCCLQTLWARSLSSSSLPLTNFSSWADVSPSLSNLIITTSLSLFLVQVRQQQS